MAKRLYQVGEPCDDCKTPTVPSKNDPNTGYCKACYIAWKNKTEGLQPARSGFHPQTPRTSDPGASQRIIELLESIDAKLEEIRYNSLKDENGNKVPF